MDADEVQELEGTDDEVQAHTQRLFSLLSRASLGLSDDEASELAYWRERVSPLEWRELQAAVDDQRSTAPPQLAGEVDAPAPPLLSLTESCVAIRAEVRQARSQVRELGAEVLDSLTATEAEWNRFVGQFARVWEATVAGAEMLAVDATAARQRVRDLEEHITRRGEAGAPTRVLAAAIMPAPDEAVRCALDVRAQSIEVAEGPERRTLRFDRVAAVERSCTALPALSDELAEAVDLVAAGACATIIAEGPVGCGKSWLLDGRAELGGVDGLLGGAVHGLLAAMGGHSAQPGVSCALWLSAADVHGEVVTDLLAPAPAAGLGARGGQRPAWQPLLAAIPTYESFLQLTHHLRALQGAGRDVDARARAAGQRMGPFSLRPRAAHTVLTLHLERSATAPQLGMASLTLVELAAGSQPAARAHGAQPGRGVSQQAAVAKSVAALHSVLLALASGCAAGLPGGSRAVLRRPSRPADPCPPPLSSAPPALASRTGSRACPTAPRASRGSCSSPWRRAPGCSSCCPCSARSSPSPTTRAARSRSAPRSRPSVGQRGGAAWARARQP